MTFRDQDSRSRLEVQIRGETETRLSKMCLETVSRTETGLENYITNTDEWREYRLLNLPLVFFPDNLTEKSQSVFFILTLHIVEL